jgi:hypothetical protein
MLEGFDDRLVRWVQERARELPSPPGWDIYAGPMPEVRGISPGGTAKTIGHCFTRAGGGLIVAGLEGPGELSLVVDSFTLAGAPGRTARKRFRLPRDGVGDILTKIALSAEGTHLACLNQRGELLAFDATGEGILRIPVAGRLPGPFASFLFVSSQGCVGASDQRDAEGPLLFYVRWSEGELRNLPSGRIDAMAVLGQERCLFSSQGETRSIELPDRERWQTSGGFDRFCGPLPGSGDVVALRERELFLLSGETGASRPLHEVLPGLAPVLAPASPMQAALSADGGYLAVAGQEELAVWSLRTGVGRVFPVRPPLYQTLRPSAPAIARRA